MRRLLIGCGLVVLALLAVSTFALWQDGKKLSTTHKTPRWSPLDIEHPSYLDAEPFQRTTQVVLREYARVHHATILKEMQQEQQP